MKNRPVEKVGCVPLSRNVFQIRAQRFLLQNAVVEVLQCFCKADGRLTVFRNAQRGGAWDFNSVSQRKGRCNKKRKVFQKYTCKTAAVAV